MSTKEQISPIVAAALLASVVAILYGNFFFPHAYFRHDDWLHLGNNVRRLPQDWTLPWRGTLFFLDHEAKWFFRPMVHFTVWLFLKLYGLSHTGWLAGFLGLTVLATVFGALTVYELTKNKIRALLFCLFFLPSFHIHFGSVTWVGEGIMNCPQLLVVSASIYFFARSLAKPPWSASYLASLFFFVTALGFKESSFFLPVLFAGMSVRSQRLSQCIKRVSPFFVVLAVYLVLRFWLIPMNRSYLPQFELRFYLHPLGILLGSILLPWFVVQCVELVRQRHLGVFRPDFLNNAFLFLFPGLALLILPHLGHNFFSPGWLLLPGFIGALVLAVTKNTFPTRLPWLVVSACLIFAASLGPVVWKLNRMKWWEWHRSQKQLVALLTEASPETTEITLFDCSAQDGSAPHLQRVVGGREHIGEMWNHFHGTVIPIHILGCDAGSTEKPGTLHLWWRFPEFSTQAF